MLSRQSAGCRSGYPGNPSGGEELDELLGPIVDAGEAGAGRGLPVQLASMAPFTDFASNSLYFSSSGITAAVTMLSSPCMGRPSWPGCI